MNQTEKIYCYVDESGQDTLGNWFLVAVVILIDEKDKLEQQLLELEHSSGKHKTKWHKTKHFQREMYINGIKKLASDKNTVYYSVYKNTINFADLVALTTAKSILDKASDSYSASITVDGLDHNLEKIFASSIRKLKIRTEKVKGARDESSPCIRLADALAGLLRDSCEGQPWAKKCVEQLIKKRLVHEI